MAVITISNLMLQESARANSQPANNQSLTAAGALTGSDIDQIRVSLVCAQNLLQTLDNVLAYCDLSVDTLQNKQQGATGASSSESQQQLMLTTGVGASFGCLQDIVDELMDALSVRLTQSRVELIVLWDSPDVRFNVTKLIQLVRFGSSITLIHLSFLFIR